MIALAWDEVSALGLGTLDGGGAITGITADSRDAGPGDLFVALNSGVRYVEEARAKGAATLVPDDHEAALVALATLVRSKSDADVVAVDVLPPLFGIVPPVVPGAIPMEYDASRCAP